MIASPVRFVRIIVPVMLALMLIAACSPLVPATTPPQLAHTPGAFIAIDTQRVTAASFSVNYPDGWRVIKISVASDPIRLVFASPDDMMLVTISENPLPPQDDSPGQVQHADIIVEGERMLYLQGQAPEDESTRFEQLYAMVLASIRFTDAG